MAEQCLDDMHGVIVVDIFGCKYPTAVVRQQYERRAIGALGFGNNGDFTNAAADRLDAGGTWMPDALKKVGGGWSWTLLLQIPMVASRYGIAIVEAFYMANDLGQDASEAVPNGNHARAIKLRRLDVQQVKDAPSASDRLRMSSVVSSLASSIRDRCARRHV